MDTKAFSFSAPPDDSNRPLQASAREAASAPAASRLTESDYEPVALLRDNVGAFRLLIAGGIAVTALFWAITFSWWMRQEIGTERSVAASLIAAVTVLVYLAGYLALGRGHMIIGRRIVFFGMLLCAAFAALSSGGFTGPLVMLFFVPLVGAGLLGHDRDSLYVAIGAVGLYLALVALERTGLYQPRPVSVWTHLAVFGTSGLVLGGLAWASGRDLVRVVAQSQERAEELLKKTEQLIEKNIQQVELGSELAAAAQQLQVASQQQASGATEQASAVAQVSTTIEELGSTARQIAQSAEQVALAAQQTLENLSTGQDAVDESIQAMERIRGRVADVTTRVMGLGERSQQIGEIIDLIDNISDETHLLALNAAIEAAGAGEHGRRFAVVAAEVKSLANRTLAAAKEVKGVIAEIRQATAAAVLAAEEGSKEVERGVELAHRAGQIMDNIVMMAERTAQSAAEIGLATAQQQSASEQVVETMREIAEVARQTALGSRQMAESAAMLTAIADRLHGIAVQS